MPAPLDATVVTVTSPDANVRASVDRRYRVRFGFQRGAYQRYDESTLERQLGQLGRLAWAAYQRERRTAVERSGRVVNDWSPQRRAYREALGRIEAAGRSAAGTVEVRSTGLVRWECAIRPGSLRRLPEPRLVAELEGAVADLVTDYHHRAALLKDEFFRYDLPPRLREAFEAMARR